MRMFGIEAMVAGLFGRACAFYRLRLTIGRETSIGWIADDGPDDRTLPFADIAPRGNLFRTEGAGNSTNTLLFIDKEMEDALDDGGFAFEDFIARILGIRGWNIDIAIRCTRKDGHFALLGFGEFPAGRA